jgi:hypothetical protein
VAYRRQRDEEGFNAVVSKADLQALEKRENEFLEQMRRRLSLKRINLWLDEKGGTEKILVPVELINEEESYIRFVYALLYGDSRSNFGYNIEEDDEGSVHAADYVVPDIRFRRALTEAEHESGS